MVHFSAKICPPFSVLYEAQHHLTQKNEDILWVKGIIMAFYIYLVL